VDPYTAGVAAFWLLMALVNLAGLAAFIDAARQPSERWERSRQSQVSTLVAIALFCGLAGLFYWAAVHPRLERAGAAIEAGALSAGGPTASDPARPPTAEDRDLQIPENGWDEFRPKPHDF
jgi:hypothetical protein